MWIMPYMHSDTARGALAPRPIINFYHLGLYTLLERAFPRKQGGLHVKVPEVGEGLFPEGWKRR